MATLASILESELSEAVEVKDSKSLHRYITILLESLAKKAENMSEIGAVRTNIALLAQSMKEGFEASDRRFTDLLNHMNARFEDVSKRFNMMLAFMSAGFTLIAVLMSIYAFMK